MRLATTEEQVLVGGLRAARERWLRPAVGFNHPRDVLKDPDLSIDDKRAVLSSWLSDASAVQDQPTWRWLLGTPEPVLAADIREALLRLEGVLGGEEARHDDPHRAPPSLWMGAYRPWPG